MVFHWSLSNSKYPQVSRTHLSILAVLNNAVVWIVCSRPPTYKSPSSFNNPLVTNRKHQSQFVKLSPSYSIVFFNSIARSSYSSFFSHYFSFILWSAVTAKSTISQFLFFVVVYQKVSSSGQDYYYYYYYYYYYSLQFFYSSICWWSFTRFQ